jgi:hypothetical protein
VATFIQFGDTPAEHRQLHRNRNRHLRSWAAKGTTPFRTDYLAEHHHKRWALIAVCDINGFNLEACDMVEREHGSDGNDPTRGTVDGEHFKMWVEEQAHLR